MPKYGPFLPDIFNLLYQTLEQNNLTPDFYFTEEIFYKTLKTQRFFVAPVTDFSRKKYIFKARIEDCPETKEIFKREINFNKNSSKNKIPGLNMPYFIKSGKKPIEWFLYDYIETYSSGTIAGAWRRYQKSFPVEEVARSVVSLQKFTKNANNFKYIQKKDTNKMLKEFDFYTSRINNILRKEEIIKAREELLKNKKMLNNSTAVFTHGDFHPGNIIIKEENSAFTPFIIDWASLQLNNYVYDIAFLWATLSQYPDIQYKLIRNFIEISPETKNFDHLFKLNLIRIIPQLIETFDYINKTTGENFDKQINFLLREFKIIRYGEEEMAESKKKILKKLNLSEIKLLRKAKLNETPDFELSLCKNRKTEVNFIIKTMHRTYPDLKNRFKNEVEITKFFTKSDKNIGLQYMHSSLKSRPERFVYKYLEGEKIGNFYRINPEFLTDAIINNTFASIIKIQKNYAKIKKIKSVDFKINLDKKKKMTAGAIANLEGNNAVSANSAKRNMDFYAANFDKTPLFLCHNDLHPENLILDKENKIHIIDFNLSALNFQFFDFLTFTLCGWQNQEWIKTAISELKELYPEIMEKDSPSQISFNLSLIEASLKLTAQALPDTRAENKLIEENQSNSARKYFIEVFEKLSLFI